MDKKKEKKVRVRTACPDCGSTRTYESNKPKQGHYFYCCSCGYEKWSD